MAKVIVVEVGLRSISTCIDFMCSFSMAALSGNGGGMVVGGFDSSCKDLGGDEKLVKPNMMVMTTDSLRKDEYHPH